jgi:hypothetical protein
MGIGGVNSWAAGGATTLLGLNQYYKGKKMLKNNHRPGYAIPDEVLGNQKIAQQQALEGLPEETVNQYMSNLERGTAYGLRDMGSRSGGIAAVGRLNDSLNTGYANLASADAQARHANVGSLMEQNQNVANYKDEQFQLNKLNPYYEVQAQGLAMQGAGMQNVATGFQTAQGGGQSSNVNPAQQYGGGKISNKGYKGGDMKQDESGYWNGDQGSGWFNFGDE